MHTLLLLLLASLAYLHLVSTASVSVATTATPTTPCLHAYIMLTVHPQTNHPQHILMLHTNHRALYKQMTNDDAKDDKWKLCTYDWNPREYTLRYTPLSNDSTTQRTTHITFQPIRSQPDAPPAYVSYHSKRTTYLWKPTKNTFKCDQLLGKTLHLQPNTPNTPKTPTATTTTQDVRLPFDAIRVVSNKRASVRTGHSTQPSRWVDCSLTCRKASGQAVRRYDAVLYLKPLSAEHQPFQTALLRWGGSTKPFGKAQWMDVDGVRWVEECGGVVVDGGEEEDER